MWDRDRLLALWGLFKTRRADVSEEFNSAYEASLAAEEEQLQSHNARSDEKGSRGWWSPDDLSRIEWPEHRRKKTLPRKHPCNPDR